MTAESGRPARPSPRGDGAAGGGSTASDEDGGSAAGADLGARKRPRDEGLGTGGVRAAGPRWVAAALLVSAVAYSSWLLAGVLNPPLNSSASYASELAATDQPWSWLFRGGDLLAGVAALVAGPVVATWLRRGRPTEAARSGSGGPDAVLRLGWWCVAAFGAFTMLDAGLFPMACAPSVDSACAAAEAAGEVPLRHQVHTVTSSLAAAAPLVGLVAFAWARRGVVDVVLCGLMAAATVATVDAVMTGDGVGLAQRAQLVVVSAWLLWLAARTRRGPVESVSVPGRTRT